MLGQQTLKASDCSHSLSNIQDHSQVSRSKNMVSGNMHSPTGNFEHEEEETQL
jgi:hypothetical protein